MTESLTAVAAGESRGSSGVRRGSDSSPEASAPTGRSSPTLLPQLQASARRVSERMAQLDCEVVDVGFISDAAGRRRGRREAAASPAAI